MASFLNTLVSESPFLMLLLDLLFKSAIIVGITALIAYLFRKHLPGSSLHLLWLNSIFCLMLLPIVGPLLSKLFATAVPVGQIFTLTVTQDAIDPLSSGLLPQDSLWLTLYLIPCVILFIGLIRSGIRAYIIVADAEFAKSNGLVEIHNKIRRCLALSRQVDLKFSDAITSPFSYGLFAPAVVLPIEAKNWRLSTLEDVLIHELSHIKRLDWPTLLLSRLICIAFWINPLAWLAYSKVNENAEIACDSAVVRFGKSSTGYAENLLTLARHCKAQNNHHLLAQMILDKSTLSLRIKHLINGAIIMKTSKRFLVALPVLSMLILLVGSKTQTLAAESAAAVDQEYLPISAPAPQYPTIAANEGIEGWILYEFTVSSSGTVAEESIELVDASPAEIFDSSAYRALVEFMFQPRIVDGQSVAVPGVQYLFRYVLEDDGEPDFERDPPPARN